MKIRQFIILFPILESFCALAFNDLGGGVYQSNGSWSDTQAAINAAQDGETVRIPAGSFSWTSGIKISGRAIKIQGAGAGSLQGDSTSSVSIGTGSKTFTTKAGLDLTPGQSIRAVYMADGSDNYMDGTVDSYTGTSLVINVTSTAGSGTRSFWTFATPDTTLLRHSAGGIFLWEVIESVADHVEISGIHFDGASANLGSHMIIEGTAGGKAILVHDCRFSTDGNMGGSIRTSVNRGIIFNCSFDSGFYSGTGNGRGHDDSGIAFKSDQNTSAWQETSKMGVNDTDGLGNFYVEDCYFAGIYLQTMDFDGNSRAVIRHCTFNNSAMTSHGADTGPVGTRHYQIYDNTFIFTDVGTSTFGLDYWFFIRGGTGVITDNVMPNMNSQQWGGKLSIKMTVMNLQRSAGPNPCWGANISGNQYPAPRQVGMGRVTGQAGNDSITYKGDSEPLYIWNNSVTPRTGVVDYGDPACGNPDSTANYVVAGRDYFIDGTPKPGFIKYTYPHPLRFLSAAGPAAPRNLHIVNP